MGQEVFLVAIFLSREAEDKPQQARRIPIQLYVSPSPSVVEVVDINQGM